jgi:hypothetical protein
VNKKNGCTLSPAVDASHALCALDGNAITAAVQLQQRLKIMHNVFRRKKTSVASLDAPPNAATS